MTAAERTADIMSRYRLSKSTAQRLNNHSDAYIRMYANKHKRRGYNGTKCSAYNQAEMYGKTGIDK